MFSLLPNNERTYASNDKNKNVLHLSDLQSHKYILILNLRFSKKINVGRVLLVISTNHQSHRYFCHVRDFSTIQIYGGQPFILPYKWYSPVLKSVFTHTAQTLLFIETKTFKSQSLRIGAATSIHMYTDSSKHVC